MSRALALLERLRNTFWVLPALGITLAIVAAFALPVIDDAVDLPDAVSFNGGRDTARSVLQTIATVAVSVAGISFSVIVVALVLASQQLSPRVLSSFQRQPLNQAVLGLFLATATFSLFVLGASEGTSETVPELSVTVAMVLGALSLALFVVFLHYLVRSLNASAVIRRIAADGHRAIHEPYPLGFGDGVEDRRRAESAVRERTAGAASRAVCAPRAGYLTSVDGDDLLAAAEAHDGFVEQRCAIGDFALTGALLAEVWCPKADLDALATRVERGFELYEERLVENDVGYPLRQLADVALKGLSPSINDPTTSENAMNSVTDALVRLARQPEAPMLRVSRSGEARFRALAPSLEALVRLGFDQVRRDGASRPSFAVRLLELLAELRELGGARAAACPEIGWQALATRDHAVALAEIPADAELVRASYERLHG